MVHVNFEQPLKLILNEELEMHFNFIADDKDKALKSSSRVEGNILTWDLVNYTNPLGAGIISPIELGDWDDRRLFASFYVWTPNSSNDGRRVVNYVIYLR